MKKIILNALLILLLYGCGSSVTPEHYQKASDICETNGGLNCINTYFCLTTTQATIYCNNGVEISYYDIGKHNSKE